MILIKAPARRVGWTDLSLLPAGDQPKGPPGTPGTIRSMVFERELMVTTRVTLRDLNSSNMFEHFHIPNSFQHVSTCSNYFMIFIRCPQGPRNPMSAACLKIIKGRMDPQSTWIHMASAWLRSDVALRCFFARNLSTTLPVVPMCITIWTRLRVSK